MLCAKGFISGRGRTCVISLRKGRCCGAPVVFHKLLEGSQNPSNYQQNRSYLNKNKNKESKWLGSPEEQLDTNTVFNLEDRLMIGFLGACTLLIICMIIYYKHNLINVGIAVAKKWPTILLGACCKSGFVVFIVAYILTNTWALCCCVLLLPFVGCCVSWKMGQVPPGHPWEVNSDNDAFVLKALQKNNPDIVLFIVIPGQHVPVGLTEEDLRFAPKLRGDAPIRLPAVCDLKQITCKKSILINTPSTTACAQYLSTNIDPTIVCNRDF